LLALAVAFIVNLLAIPRMGAYGALVGLAIGYLAAASVNLYYIRFKLRS
jgi:polysaccharide transporter, PST family